MESLFENKPLLYSVAASAAAVSALASGLLPDVANHFEIVEFTSEVGGRVYINDHRIVHS